MRTEAAKPNEHFGNPFSKAGYGGTIKVDSIPDAVTAYKDWLLSGVTLVTSANKVNLNTYLKPFEAQREWILDQINQGKLDGATLLYAGKLAARGEGMHPTALAEVVEQLRGSQISVQAKPTEAAEVKPEVKEVSQEEKETFSPLAAALTPDQIKTGKENEEACKTGNIGVAKPRKKL